MKTLKETLDEFDELNIFSTPITEDGLRTFVVDIQEAKDFLSQSIKTALESVVVEKHCEDEIGWNDCREQLLENIENYLKN